MKGNIKRILLIAGVVLAALGMLYYIAVPPALPMTEVQPKTARLTLVEEGEIKGTGIINIYPLVQGELLELLVQEGQAVLAGDPLCTLDDEPYRRLASQSKSTIEGYQAQLAAAQQQTGNQVRSAEESRRLQALLIQGSQNDLKRAKQDLERAAALHESGAIAQIELEAAQAAVEQSRLALESNRQQLAIIEAEGAPASLAGYYQALINMEQANLAQLEQDIKNCTILAPADGIITALPARHTNYITSSLPVAELSGDGKKMVEAFLPIQDIRGIEAGDEVLLTLKLREGDMAFPGEIMKIHANAEIILSALGLEERKVKVEVAPDLSPLGAAPLGIGYKVEVQFILYSEENQLTVPKTALFRDEEKELVWVLKKGRAQAQEVETGLELRTETIILSGLSPGDMVITDANQEAVNKNKRFRPE